MKFFLLCFSINAIASWIALTWYYYCSIFQKNIDF